jgi:dihydrofolate reductase
MSLDAFIADPQGGTGFLVSDPDYDQNAFFKSIDTVLMGRKTFEVAGGQSYRGLRTYVFSRTLRPEDFPGVTIVSAEDAASTVAALRAEDGKDIWLCGGGELAGSLLEAGLVDTVEIGMSPILLGQGVPLVAPLPRPARLELVEHQVYRSGMVVLTYAVRRDEA